MGTFAVGDVVLVLFPYADFSQFKKRPVLIAGEAEFSNFILCQITSKSHSSRRAIPLGDNDFTTGGLSQGSFIRSDKIFTIEQSIIDRKLGSLKKAKLDEVQLKIRRIFS